MFKSIDLTFQSIPKTPVLFYDYIYQFQKVRSFFPRDSSIKMTDPDGSNRLISNAEDRCNLVEVLHRQNGALGCGPKVVENIQRLGGNRCFAVVTGQQVGLFTGPAYTIYKALTAIKLAQEYSNQGLEAVPIFWMATDDHDLDEVCQTKLISTESCLEKFRYLANRETFQQSVGKIQFEKSITGILRNFLETLPNSEFKPNLVRELNEAYSPGISFSEAFAKIFNFLFSEYGLILLNPQDPVLKNKSKSVFSKVAKEWLTLNNLLKPCEQELNKSGYTPQVPVTTDTSFLFIEDEGKRRGLMCTSKGFQLKGTNKTLSLDALTKLIETAPERISPNVLLRPIVQDSILPTLAYVAGPSEVAYFAQLLPVYRIMNLEMPMIFPRTSLTIIENRSEKILNRHQLKFTDLFKGTTSALRSLLDSSVDESISLRFDEIKTNIAEHLGKMEELLKVVDPTLTGALGTTQKKIQYQIESLQTKFSKAELGKQRIVARQIENVFNSLYPSNNLQEREINFFYFLSRYGVGLISQLHENINLYNLNHQLVYLSKS